ncbi:CG15916 [Drosophila busckii]|uniref:CG15916 n=1 Tax=Drosophila busckii TaxID=30019 RepID=A0A0M4EYA8_DROBS|nr:putative ribosome-binding factor A, mitochondrial [Drosophila busckii]ALC48942.1 CG15916 [Drosophila busckii]
MFRNRLLPLHHSLQLPSATCNWTRGKSSTSTGSSNVARQSKILGKLFGNRVVGTKRRWYPSQDVNSSSSGGGSYQPPSVVFQASQFGKSNSPGAKHNTRRMSVLNKLFMTHITDLLATGEAAEAILGRGLQVSRIKISSDFSCINVYWLGSGELLNDTALEGELQRCSGLLRHELSQLRLMGEVPRIKFVRDKTGSNINHVEGILRTLDLKPAEEEAESNAQQLQSDPSFSYDVAQTARQEFYGNAAAPVATTELPEMRHDVLGLDHRRILDKILTKMRKSKQAWEQHEQQLHQSQQHCEQLDSPELLRIQQQVDELKATETSNKFATFLAKRRERKQTPERKKYRRDQEDWTAGSALIDHDELQLLSKEQRHRYTQEDYIVEEEKDKPSHRGS